MRRKPQITKASRRTNCIKIHVTKAEYQEKLIKMEEPYMQVIEKKVIKTKVKSYTKSKVTQKSLLELHGDYTTCGKAVQSYPPKLTQFGAFLFNATSWRGAARSRKVICTPVVTLRWIITSLFAGDADPTPKTRTERLFKLSLPLFGAQSPGGGTAHKQTRPVQLYRDQSIALERNCRFGNGLELSAEERLFKLSFPRALFEGGTLPINRLC